VAVDELAGEVFGDNDNLSAMVANLVDADLLMMLGDVDGLYTADPHLDPDAKLIPVVERLNVDVEAMGGGSWDNSGQGGMATKLESAGRATATGVSVVIANGLEPEVVNRLAHGERIGTYLPATSTKMESRKRWMLSGVSTMGEIAVDEGASRALLNDNRSLLPAGVKEVRGAFERGQIVAILGAEADQIAAGIANYSSTELEAIKGAHSNRIEELLGHNYGAEVVHRNNMVVL
jgi:glutamate 5-kinase